MALDLLATLATCERPRRRFAARAGDRRPRHGAGGRAGRRRSARVDVARCGGARSSQPAPSSRCRPGRPAGVFRGRRGVARAKRDIQRVDSLERGCGSRASNRATLRSRRSRCRVALAQTLVATTSGMDRRALEAGAVAGSTAPTLREAAEAREAERASGAVSYRSCARCEIDQGGRIVDVRQPEVAPTPPPCQADDEVDYADSGMNAADDG